MQELKDIRELLHYEKLAVDPDIERKNKEKIEKTIKSFKKNSKPANRQNKGPVPFKKQKRS